jgi:hypothetical protein
MHLLARKLYKDILKTCNKLPIGVQDYYRGHAKDVHILTCN